MKLKAMTYNICSGKNMARRRDLEFAASVIREAAPDFVTLNEVRRNTSDIGPVDQAWELGRLTGYFPVFGRSIDIMGGEYGNALLTRLPLMACEVIHIPDPPRTGEGFYEHRSVLKCRLSAGGKPLTVLCTHFGLMPSEHENAVRTVLGILEGVSGPVMLMGDLNLTPDAPALAPIMAKIHDVSEGRPLQLTFPSDTPEIKIDYIFCSDEIRPLSVRSVDTTNSDHRPLIAEIEL